MKPLFSYCIWLPALFLLPAAAHGQRPTDSGKIVIFITPGDTTRYTGDIKDGKRQGQGTAYYQDSATYTGSWENDQSNGYGILRWSNGTRYEGNFVNDMIEGQGTMYWADSGRYTGGWVKNKREGYGEFTRRPQGRMDGKKKYVVYKGNWSNDVKCGRGAYYNRDGKRVTKGLFRDDHIYAGPLIKTDSFSNNKPLNTLFIEPFAMIDLQTGCSLRLGTEHRLGKYWGVVGTAGVFAINASGWTAKAELKRYFRKDDPGRKPYISAEYYYKQTMYRSSDSIFATPHYRVDDTYTKFISGFRIKGGYVQLLAHKLMVEYYFGAGIKYRVCTSSLTQNQYENINYGEDDYGTDAYTWAVSKSIRPDIVLGIRFGMRY